MDNRDVIFGDAHLKQADKATRLPDDVRFVCSYELFVMFIDIEEAAFFRRTEAGDELWIAMAEALPNLEDVAKGRVSPQDLTGIAMRCGCAFIVVTKGDERSACLSLLDLLIRSRHGFEWPGEFIAGGIVDQAAFDSLVGGIEAEFEENRQQALQSETEIIQVARELGLSPRPTGDHPSDWCANCPGMNHVLWLSTATNTFGCPWCRRKGSMEELRAFVEERKGPRKSSPSDG